MPSVGATENLILAASMAVGTTVIENAAREPEVEDLAQVVRKMGVRVEGAGTSTIEIEGRDELGGFDHEVVPDRIEAGTFLIAAAITGGDVRVDGARREHLEGLLEVLDTVGARIECEENSIRIQHGHRAIGPASLTTAPFPGFPTDLQAQTMAMLCLARGRSRITETIFENRFMHVPELVRLGAEIAIDGSTATIDGVEDLEGAEVMATDLRASVSLVLAALAARNTTRLQRVYHLDRGYENLEAKLTALGADVARVRGPAATFVAADDEAEAAAAGAGGGERTAVAAMEDPRG
jgi:UDP-N-acetylglucosamine 1-carboxyvinyltransferase